MRGFFKKFLKRNFPSKGDGKRQVFLKLLFLALLAVMVACIWQLACFLLNYFGEVKTDSQIASLYTPTSEASSAVPSSSQASSKSVSADFSKLLKVNSDVKGWIKVPGTRINNVVVQTDDNSYYLTHSVYKKYSNHGTLFLDYRDKIETLSKNLLIYGHHMKDGTMFHDLIKYKKLSFYSKSPVIEFNTLYGEMQWKIFAVFITNADPKDGTIFNYLQTDFSSDTDFENFITQIKRRSLFNIGVDVGASDTILSLSTCTYEFNDARLVVVARLLRAGESTAAAKASKNSKPLMPDVWYKKYGGTKPTFSN